MEYTIGFYDTFEHLVARASVHADSEIPAITLAAETCNVHMANVGRIELTSSDREWLARLDAETPTTNEDVLTMLEHAIEHLIHSDAYWQDIGYLDTERAIVTLRNAHKAVGPLGQVPSSDMFLPNASAGL